MLVDNEIDIRTARWLVLDAAATAERGEPYRTESALAKLVASEASGRVVDRAMQIHGGLGVAKDLPLERWYREIRIRRIGEGPSEVQKHVVARDILAPACVETRTQPPHFRGARTMSRGLLEQTRLFTMRSH